MKTIYWVIGVALFGVGLFVYVLIGDSQKTVPKIKLSYFSDESEIAQSVQKRLEQETKANSFYWIGIEPEKLEQFEVATQIMSQIEKIYPGSHIVVDAELKPSAEWLKMWPTARLVEVKNGLTDTAQILEKYEKNKEPYILVTASIYSNSVLIKNQIHQMKQAYAIHPMTFSMAYFAVDAEDEKNMLFPCETDDHTGTANWGCMVVNKARFIRRKIDNSIQKPWVGLMDLIGEKDYMILLKKRKLTPKSS